MRQDTPRLIINDTRGGLVCKRAVVASKPLTRMRGLLGRRSIPAGEGLLLTPAPSIHTFFMRFPIDAVFLDGDLSVVKLVAKLEAWRIASSRHARSVLELAGGEIARRGIEVGDRLAVVDLATTSASLTPKRVMLVAGDRRFRSVASMLLTRRDYRVLLPRTDDDIAEATARECAEVVVIDASSSLIEASRQAAKLRALCPSVGVVTVSDDPRHDLGSLSVVPKWGAFASLLSAIEHASGFSPARGQQGARR